MNNVKTFIESGILEMYVLGVASENENKEVAKMAVLNPAIQTEIDKISIALYDYLRWNGIQPPREVRDNLLGRVDNKTQLLPGKVY